MDIKPKGSVKDKLLKIRESLNKDKPSKIVYNEDGSIRGAVAQDIDGNVYPFYKEDKPIRRTQDKKLVVQNTPQTVLPVSQQPDAPQWKEGTTTGQTPQQSYNLLPEFFIQKAPGNSQALNTGIDILNTINRNYGIGGIARGINTISTEVNNTNPIDVLQNVNNKWGIGSIVKGVNEIKDAASDDKPFMSKIITEGTKEATSNAVNQIKDRFVAAADDLKKGKPLGLLKGVNGIMETAMAPFGIADAILHQSKDTGIIADGAGWIFQNIEHLIDLNQHGEDYFIKKVAQGLKLDGNGLIESDTWKELQALRKNIAFIALSELGVKGFKEGLGIIEKKYKPGEMTPKDIEKRLKEDRKASTTTPETTEPVSTKVKKLQEKGFTEEEISQLHPETAVELTKEKVTEVKKEAKVPVMVTKKMRSSLSDLGYTTDQIKELNREDANKIISENKYAENSIHELVNDTPEKIPGAFSKEPWEYTKDEFVKENPLKITSKGGKQPTESVLNGKHARSVKSAYDSGKEVPPEVLADYPKILEIAQKKLETKVNEQVPDLKDYSVQDFKDLIEARSKNSGSRAEYLKSKEYTEQIQPQFEKQLEAEKVKAADVTEPVPPKTFYEAIKDKDVFTIDDVVKDTQEKPGKIAKEIKKLTDKGHLEKTPEGYKTSETFKLLADEISRDPKKYGMRGDKLNANPVYEIAKGINEFVVNIDDVIQKGEIKIFQKYVKDNIPKLKEKFPIIDKISESKTAKELSKYLETNPDIPKGILDLRKDAKIEIQRYMDLAKEIGKKLSFDTSGEKKRKYSYVEQRKMQQLIRGGETSERFKPLKDKAVEVNKLLEDFHRMGRELGVLPVETYNSKLPKKRIHELLTDKAKFEQTLNKLIDGTSDRAAITEKESASMKYLSDRIGGIDRKVKNHYKLGGTGYFKRAYRYYDEANIRNVEKMLNEKAKTLSEKKVFDKLTEEQRNKLTNEYGYKKIKLDDVFNALDREDIPLDFREGLLNAITETRKTVEGTVQLPDKKEYGLLRGKYVSKAIADSLTGKSKAQLIADQKALLKKYGYKDPTHLDLTSAIYREDLPISVRKALGEVLEAAYPTTKAIMAEGKDIALGRMFEAISENPDWVSSQPREGFIKIGDHEKLGKLKNMYVQEPVALEIQTMLEITKPGVTNRLLQATTRVWKFNKTIFNPGTHARNLMSNTLLLDYSGTTMFDQARLMPEAFRLINGKGKFINDWKLSGLEGSTFIKNELGNFEAEVNKPTLNDIAKDPLKFTGEKLKEAKYNFDKGDFADKYEYLLKTISLQTTPVGKYAAKLYQAEETLFKAIKFIHEREKGKSINEATAQADKWLFDYSDVPKQVDILRKSAFGIPFSTFTYKVVPRVFEAALQRPVAFWSKVLFISLMTNVSLKQMNVTEEDWQQIIEVLPDRIKEGSHMLLPWKDANGKMQLLNLTYIMPYQPVIDYLKATGVLNAMGLTEAYASETGGLLSLMGNPVFTMIADLRANKNTFLGKEIWNAADTAAEKTQKALDYVYKLWLPPFYPMVPGVTRGGMIWDKIGSSIKQSPDYRGRTYDWPYALSSMIFGLKTDPIEEEIFIDSKISGYKKRIMELTLKKSGLLKDDRIDKEERLKQANAIDAEVKTLEEKSATLDSRVTPASTEASLLKKMISKKQRDANDSGSPAEKEKIMQEINLMIINLDKIQQEKYGAKEDITKLKESVRKDFNYEHELTTVKTKITKALQDDNMQEVADQVNYLKEISSYNEMPEKIKKDINSYIDSTANRGFELDKQKVKVNEILDKYDISPYDPAIKEKSKNRIDKFRFNNLMNERINDLIKKRIEKKITPEDSAKMKENIKKAKEEVKELLKW
ncbi:hypothetical protein BH10BAC5_BH10BAC5_16900 [soil metagenome]